jgi:hypothetical protein
MTREDVLREFGWYENEVTYREAVWYMAAEIARLRALTPPPAPRVVVLDEWVVVGKADKIQSVRVPHRDDDLARIANHWFPADAPHRVVRVALVEDPALADADAAMTEARQDEIEHAEGERIFDRVCQALQLDPNHGDCDSGDHADFIVSAVERHIERLKLSALADAGAGGDE